MTIELVSIGSKEVRDCFPDNNTFEQFYSLWETIIENNQECEILAKNGEEFKHLENDTLPYLEDYHAMEQKFNVPPVYAFFWYETAKYEVCSICHCKRLTNGT